MTFKQEYLRKQAHPWRSTSGTMLLRIFFAIFMSSIWRSLSSSFVVLSDTWEYLFSTYTLHGLHSLPALVYAFAEGAGFFASIETVMWQELLLTITVDFMFS